MTGLSPKKILSLAAIILGLATQVATAQWQKVGPQVFTAPDPQKGCAISYADGVVWAGGHSLWRSDDLGLTWQQSTTFPVTSGTIMGIYFFDRSNGYVLGDFNPYVTSNGGLTWSQLPNHSLRWGAFGSTADTFFLSASGELDIIVKGVKTKQVVGTEWISPVLSGHGMVYYLDNSIAYRSDNGGSTWSQGTDAEADCNAMALDSCDPNTIYLVNEEIWIPNDHITGVFVSHDNGATWSLKNAHGDYYYCGNITTSKFAVYAQTQDGVIRSTDKGETWMPIGGPYGHPDNLALSVIADSILLTIDTFGNLWRTDNDGGNPFIKIIPKPQLLSAASLFEKDSLAACDTSTTAFSLSTCCRTDRLTKAMIVGPDNSAYTVSTVIGRATDSCSVTFHPTKNGKHDARLLLIYGTDTLSVVLAGVGVSASHVIASTNSLFQSTTISSCDSSALDQALIHYLCSSRKIVSATIGGPDAAEYQITHQGHDGTLFIDSFDIKYAPTANHQTNATLIVTYDDGSTASIALNGTAQSPPAPQLANPKDTLFKTARLYTCEVPVPDSTLVILNCNHRKVVSEVLGGTDVSNYAIIRWTRSFTTDQDSFFVTFHPAAPGPSNGTLTITYDDGTTLTVPLLGEGLANPIASVTAFDVQLKDTIGALVRAPIVIAHDQTLAAVEFRLLFDTSLLIFDRFTSSSDSTLASSELGSGLEFLRTAVRSDTTGDTVYAYFYWFPTTVGVTIDSIDSIKAIPIADGCPITINPTTSSHITGPVGCETPLLSYFVRYGTKPFLSIHPNPASTTLTIESNATALTILRDALGRVVSRFESTPKQIDVSDVPSGLYYLELQSGQMHITKPLIITH